MLQLARKSHSAGRVAGDCSPSAPARTFWVTILLLPTLLWDVKQSGGGRSHKTHHTSCQLADRRPHLPQHMDARLLRSHTVSRALRFHKTLQYSVAVLPAVVEKMACKKRNAKRRRS